MTRLKRMGGETFRSLHVRNFRLFFTGQLISQVGNWLTLIAQTLLAYVFGSVILASIINLVAGIA